MVPAGGSGTLFSSRVDGDGPATYHVIRWNSPGMLKKNKTKTDVR